MKDRQPNPSRDAAEIDRKIDDGLPYSGAFQFSAYSGSGNPPEVGGTSSGSCTSNDADTGLWNETAGQPNCGGASLL